MKKYSFDLDQNKIELLELYYPDWKKYLQDILTKESKILEEKKIPKDVREYLNKVLIAKKKDLVNKKHKASGIENTSDIISTVNTR
jgi:hypothetical protein